MGFSLLCVTEAGRGRGCCPQQALGWVALHTFLTSSHSSQARNSNQPGTAHHSPDRSWKRTACGPLLSCGIQVHMRQAVRPPLATKQASLACSFASPRASMEPLPPAHSVGRPECMPHLREVLAAGIWRHNPAVMQLLQRAVLLHRTQERAAGSPSILHKQPPAVVLSQSSSPCTAHLLLCREPRSACLACTAHLQAQHGTAPLVHQRVAAVGVEGYAICGQGQQARGASCSPGLRGGASCC